MQPMHCAAACLLASTLAAQTYRDDFSYPDGPIVPGWTQQRGTWQVTSGRLAATSGALWSYITKDGFSARNCVLDGEFFFVGSAVQFAGLTARHPGGSADSNLLMVKIQNNGGAADFDRVFCYEQPVALGTFFADIPGGTLQAFCRMVVLDAEFWIEVDANQDGIYEQALPPRPITRVTNAGFLGMDGYSTSQMDNFEFFDAVLVPQVGAVPRIGTNYDLRLDTPSPTVPWLGLLSRGNAGIPIDGGRAIPLSADGLLLLSLGLGFAGVTDGQGKAIFTIPLPNDPSLVGAGAYAGAITIGAFGVEHIANEQYFLIQP